MRAVVLTGVIVFLFAQPGRAADNERVVKLTLTPAGRPEPAMKYRLSPTDRELVPGNAAALYYRAIVQMQNDKRQLVGENIDKDMQSAIDGIWLDLPPDQFPRADAAKGLERWSSALAEAELAARRRGAQWDLPLKEHGIQTLLPEVQEMRSLARLLALKAKLALAEKNYDEAARTLETMIQLGQHVSESGTLVSSLVGVACDAIALNEAEFWVNTPGSPSLYWALTALRNPLIDIGDGLESEHYWVGSALPYQDILATSVLSADQGRELTRALGNLMGVATEGSAMEIMPGIKLPIPQDAIMLVPALATYPSAKRELIARGRPAAEVERMPVAQVVVLAWVQTYREQLDEMVAWGHRPYAESRRAIARIDEAADERNRSPAGFFARLLLPAINAAMGAGARLDQRVALLRTVEALRLYAAAHDGALPANLKEVTEVPIPRDPATGVSFAYSLSDGTATLQSRERSVYQHTIYEITIRK
ncbi:MAG: hypothetical protein K2Y37_09130 [Pirellulales bacterium]|nr:hypothetical protein [Pirellulales bacterium]